MALTVPPRFATGGKGVASFQRVRPEDTWAGGLIAPIVGRAEEIAGAIVEENTARETADLSMKAVEDFDRFQRELNDDDFATYEQRARDFWSEWEDQNVSGANWLVRGRVQEAVAPMKLKTTLLARDMAEGKRRDLSRADFVTRYGEGLAALAADPTGGIGADRLKLTFNLLDLKQAAGDFTAEEVAKLKEGARVEMGAAYVRGWIAKEPARALALVNDPAANGMTKGLDPDTLRVLRAEAERERDARNAVAVRQQQQQAQLAAMDLEIKVSRGEAGEVEIYEAMTKGVISPSAAADLVIRSDKVTKERKAEGDLRQRVTDAIHGTGAPLSPGNADDRKAVDLAYTDFATSIEGLPDADERASLTVGWVARTGILPGQLDDMMRAGARGAGDDVLAAADFYGRLQQAAPLVAKGLEGSDYTFLATVQHYVETGVAGPRAVALAQADVVEARAPEREERRAKWAEGGGKMEQQARQWLAGKLDDTGFLFGSDTSLPDGLVGEFAERAERYYLETGNAEAAQTMALRDIKATWGKSKVGGAERWMQYPPELVYGTGSASDSEWMTRQLRDDLTLHRLGNLGSGQELPAEADAFHLVPAPSAGRQEAPAYLVEYVREDGVIELLTDPKTGQPLLWRPDWSKGREPGDQREAIDKAEADARERRGQVEALQNAPGWEEIRE